MAKLLNICLILFIIGFLTPSFAETPITDITQIDAAFEKEEQAISQILMQYAEAMLTPIVTALATFLFYPVPIPFTDGGIPFLVLWLIGGGVFFTLRLGFINFRLFGHALKVVTGRYSSGDEPGEVTHAQALFAAVSATVGLGNIAGVAIAVSTGGPGAVIWMVLAGFLGMSTKFAEVTLGQKYRQIDENGRISGGAFHYLRNGLAEINMPRLGKVLAIIFAIFCIFGSLGGGNMFQANQTLAIITEGNGLHNIRWILAIVLAIAVGTVLIGGIRRIAKVAEAIVPLMGLIYIVSALVILIANSDKLADAFALMFNDAFTGDAIGGGIFGALIAGFKRSAFSNEAGLGSAPIAHATAKTNEPVREGCVALLEPFIDTIVICFLSGLVITVTGVYQNTDVGDGVLLTSAAFATVIDWFPKVLMVAVTLFAFSTMITWSYYGERAWQYLFGSNRLWVFHVIFCTATFIGGIANLGVVIDFSDLLLLSMALPNLLGLYLLSNKLSGEVKEYIRKLKANEFTQYDRQGNEVIAGKITAKLASSKT